MESRGLGDSIAKITKKTGIEWLTKALVPDCGCEDRQAWLNEKFPYKNAKTKEAVTMTDLQMSKLEKLTDGLEMRSITKEQIAMITALHNEVFGQGKRPSGCASCIKKNMKELLTVYNQKK